MKMITENFGMEFKKECIMFKIKKSTYKIPSKIYPLKNRDFEIFWNENTVQVTDEGVKKLFNACRFQMSRCYANTEMLLQGSKAMKIEGVKYYSGWVFTGCSIPKHHAWAVYNNESILDGNMLQDMFEIFKDKNDLSKREQANMLKECLESKKPNHEKFCFGKVIAPIIYIGCEGTYDESQDLIRKALEITNGKHPSYPNASIDQIDLSETQKIIKGLI